MEVMACTFIVSATVIRLVSLLHWIQVSNKKRKWAVLMFENLVCHPGFDNLVLEEFLNSPTTIALTVNLIRNIFILIFLTLSVRLNDMHGGTDAWNLVKRLAKNVIYKGTPLFAFAVPKSRGQAGLWLTWLIVVCALKTFETLVRDHLQRLNASPFTIPSDYLGVYCVSMLALFIDTLCIRGCLLIYQIAPSSVLLLLFFEPLSITFKTLQGVFQLLDTWLNHSAAGSEWKWKHAILRNVSLFRDIMTMLMAHAHYVQIWHAFRNPFPIGC